MPPALPSVTLRALVIDAQEQLNEILRQSPLAERSTADYQPLLEDAEEALRETSTAGPGAGGASGAGARRRPGRGRPVPVPAPHVDES